MTGVYSLRGNDTRPLLAVCFTTVCSVSMSLIAYHDFVCVCVILGYTLMPHDYI
jgi:hypothetical protein